MANKKWASLMSVRFSQLAYIKMVKNIKSWDQTNPHQLPFNCYGDSGKKIPEPTNEWV